MSRGMLHLATGMALVVTMLLATVPQVRADGHVQITLFDPTPESPASGDECTITFQALADTPQLRDDVTRVKAVFDDAIDNSADMRAKVADACSKNGQNFIVAVLRDHVGIFIAGVLAGMPATIALDMGDYDDFSSDVEGDAIDVLALSAFWLPGILAHEFDHGRHTGTSNHRDPEPMNLVRNVTGRPVDDENRVLTDLSTGIIRNEYGHLSAFTRQAHVDFTINGRKVVFNLTQNRGAREVQNKLVPHVVHSAPPSITFGIPSAPCGVAPCYPVIGAGDADLDGVPDSIDNCIGLANPQQSDHDGDALGSSCDPDDDADGASRAVEAGTGSADHDPSALPEHWACAAEPMACSSPVDPCTDTIDNDLDGQIDFDDPGCVVPVPGGIEFPESIPPGQAYPDYHHVGLGGVPEKQDALLASATVHFDHDLDGTVDSVSAAQGVVVLRHDPAFLGEGGLRTMQGSLLDLSLRGFDPTLGDFVLNSPELFDFFFDLTAKQTGSDFPASGRLDFLLELDTSHAGQLDQVVAGLQSSFVASWQPFESVWTSFGPPMIFSPAGGGDPVVEIVSMTVRFERDSDFDGTFDASDNCPTDANPGQGDGDADGTGDVCDCDEGDPTVWSRPPGLSLLFLDGSTLVFSADGPPGSQLDVVDIVSSGTPQDFITNAACVATNVPFFASGVTDTSVPAPGEVLFYLGQFENNCPGTQGEGPPGSGSDGVVHLIRDCD